MWQETADYLVGRTQHDPSAFVEQRSHARVAVDLEQHAVALDFDESEPDGVRAAL